MDKDRLMRGALWTSVFYNLGGAYLLAFPSSSLGQFVRMPTPVPPIYCAISASFVILFGGAYAWLARQREINRQVVAIATIGKAGSFSIILVFWLLGLGPSRGVVAGSGDLIFACIFTWWLFTAR